MKSLIGWTLFLGLIMLLILEVGCDKQARGFALPQGDIAEGKVAFFELGCNHCHSAGDIQWIGRSDGEEIHVKLGGEVYSIKTYGELVTSVINPSHKIAYNYKEEMTTEAGESKMRLYNEVMTVQNLVDIVTFLQNEYDVTPPPTRYYAY